MAGWYTEAPVTFSITDLFAFSGLGASAHLVECHAHWGWTTKVENGIVTEGAQLSIGTPFSKKYLSTADYANVRVFAKIRLGTLDHFSNIYIGISDSGAKVDYTTIDTSSWADLEWHVIEHSKAGSWGGDPAWETENLRVVLTFFGPTSGVGDLPIPILVDVEWIAIHLSGDTL